VTFVGYVVQQLRHKINFSDALDMSAVRADPVQNCRKTKG